VPTASWKEAAAAGGPGMRSPGQRATPLGALAEDLLDDGDVAVPRRLEQLLVLAHGPSISRHSPNGGRLAEKSHENTPTSLIGRLPYSHCVRRHHTTAGELLGSAAS